MCNCKAKQYELIPELEAVLGNYGSLNNREYEGGPVKPPTAFVRNFSGAADECRAALRLAGKTGDEALAIINKQVESAIRMLRNAAARLQQGARTKRTNQVFLRIFRVMPNFVPPWFKQLPTRKDRGDVIADRCTMVANLLASGSIRFFCAINGTNCPDCATSSPEVFACSSWGNNRVICLGNSFWRDMKNGNSNSMLSTLIHEPFHITLGRYVTEHSTHSNGRSVGKFGDINCTVQFVFEINGLMPPQRVIDRCRKIIVRIPDTGFAP